MMQPGPVMIPITSIALSFAQEIGHLAQLISVLATVHQANWLLTGVQGPAVGLEMSTSSCHLVQFLWKGACHAANALVWLSTLRSAAGRHS